MLLSLIIPSLNFIQLCPVLVIAAPAPQICHLSLLYPYVIAYILGPITESLEALEKLQLLQISPQPLRALACVFKLCDLGIQSIHQIFSNIMKMA